MRALVQEKERAMHLRKKGYTYKEILKEVPVSKSSLSLWLSELPLTQNEKAALRRRKDGNITRGRARAASVLRNRRLKREQEWLREAKEMYKKYKNDPLFSVGIALYWAEGAKRVNQWSFSNSDEDMIKVMMLWLERFVGIEKKDLFFRLYIHKPYANEGCERWWAQKIGVNASQFTKTIYKPTQLGVKKRPKYKGCLRIEVRKSKKILCQMKFWRNMLVECHGKQ